MLAYLLKLCIHVTSGPILACIITQTVYY